MKSLKNILVTIFMVLMVQCSLPGPPAENITVADIFGNNMVLQQDLKITVWGNAEPGGLVTVSLGKSTVSGKVRKEGSWLVKLPKMAAGGPCSLTVAGADRIIFENVMIGEVWLCSGQSNMNMPLDQWGRVNNYEAEIQNANYPNIRLFQTDRVYALTPQTSVGSTGWLECSQENISGFSAVVYFFGRELYQKLKVPIGLVHSSSGGTPVEAWTSRERLNRYPEFTEVLDELALRNPVIDDSVEQTFKSDMAEWRKVIVSGDRGIKGKFYRLPLSISNEWPQMTLPQPWEKGGLPDFDGTVWFRKVVTLPANLNDEVWTLNLGPTDDIDAIWINGEFVGKNSSKNWPTIYELLQDVLHIGENTVDVWVLDLGQKGGIWGQPAELSLTSRSGREISLVGEWFYQVCTDLKDFPEPPKDPQLKRRPTVLYNAMIRPLIPFTIRGVIWYQGESNASRAYQYRNLFPNLIENWRKDWDQGDFPFLFVQIASYGDQKSEPGESKWAELREAQTMTLSQPNTGMAVTIDIGDADDVHPKNKQEVGRRLALLAFDNVYNIDTVSSGPVYSGMKIEGNRVRVIFENADSGLKTSDGKPLTGFAIAGVDRKFVWAETVIEDNSVVLWNDEITSPVSVRYAWADNPECNLVNGAGLPATPFRMDKNADISNDRQ